MRLAPLFFIAVLLALMPSPALRAQDSVQVLEPPSSGPSSGESSPSPAAPGSQPPCGTQPLSIARMGWPSASILAEIHSRLLTAHFQCNVTVVTGDLAATGSSMGATGQPAVAPELWAARIPEIWNAAMQGQKVRQAGATYSDSPFEGWFVPEYSVQQWPEVATIDGLKSHAGDFAAPATGTRGRFISCPADWACAVVNRNMLRAYGLDQLYDIVEPANRFEMDTLIAEAVGRKQPVLFYYWQPNAILAQFAFRPVELAAYEHDAFQCLGRSTCSSPLPSGFAPDPVVIALAEWVYLDAPQVAAYFSRAHMPFAEMNRLLQQLGDAGATPETVADRFVAERGEVWRPWVGLPAGVAQ